MWGQEKQNDASLGEQVTDAAAGSTTEDTGDIIAFIGKGVEFKGTISYSGTVRIDGYLDGETHTDGVLFNGDLKMAHAVRELPREDTLRPIGVIAPPDIKRVNG